MINQTPEPGALLIHYRGDVALFTLALESERQGTGWLRTNIGRAGIQRDEIIRHVEDGAPLLSRDWADIPMTRVGPGRYSLSLPLLEVGRFEAKAFYLPEGSHEPVWPGGGNVVIKVEPADTCCSNTIYTVFVRQFGPNRFARQNTPEEQEAVRRLDSLGYAVIPRSGTFRDVIKELDFIVGDLRCRIIQLLPIHPTPTVYARMGRFGSPFAALNFRDVDPSLAEFDRMATPLEQLGELANAIHARAARLFIDIPVNHTGWASSLQVNHPEWFARDCERRFESPGAWGVTWEDLSKLDYRHPGLWKHMADVFLFWCRHGVDGFRCDAGYMVPYPVWEYIVAKVRSEYPDTVFMLEGLGGKLEVVNNLLSGANLDWAYSELFQNYDRHQLESYLPGCIHTCSTRGTLVHFAETHDNNRLASVSHTYARMRTALSALFSQAGAFGITNGVEWFADEKVDVHDAGSLRWGHKENQVAHVARLNAIMESHPCFHAGASLRLVEQGLSNALALVRESASSGQRLLVLVNLDVHQPGEVAWAGSDFAVPAEPLHDLVSGARVAVEKRDGLWFCRLGPGQTLCLTGRAEDLDAAKQVEQRRMLRPERSEEQSRRAKVLEICRHKGVENNFPPGQVEEMEQALMKDPRAFCCAACGGQTPCVTAWAWPRDTRRKVMLPPGHFLLVTAPHAFTVELRHGHTVIRNETSLTRDDETFFAVLLPPETPEGLTDYQLFLTVYIPGSTRHTQTVLSCLPPWEKAAVRTSYCREEIRARDIYALCTNGRGAMSQVRGAWGEITTQYDALLAGNLSPDHPEDRHVMLTRCRAWLVYRGYSHEINLNCLDSFSTEENGTVTWSFHVPAGQGKMIVLDVRLRLEEGRNILRMEFRRSGMGSSEEYLDDEQPVKIILRPDVEDRTNHAKTKAYLGPEAYWRNAVASRADGFLFAPAGDRRLHVRIRGGQFILEPEWQYMVAHPFDAERGFDGHSDLFSPGYLTIRLRGGEASMLEAGIFTNGSETLDTQSGLSEFPDSGQEKAGFGRGRKKPEAAHECRLDTAAKQAIRHFIVKRNELKTVIAGYPWFLDWGRDTLICLRGMIAAGMLEESRQILLQFARFESQGTLPNMICGGDASNRDTSDAPLWFFTACRDYVQAAGSRAFFNDDCGGRTVRQVLESIGRGYRNGTPNGIRMDPDSGLIFSPSHFTWMDTNFPAGSPRQGYPVEIQALWHAALRLLAEVARDGEWDKLAARVRESIQKYYAFPGGKKAERGENSAFFSDCLHAHSGQGAAGAHADDALRPNQLLLITLGAVEDRALCGGILAACEELLIPGAIRSLADRGVRTALPIYHQESLLNDPKQPYWGRYTGDEDTRRKPAYHNGTGWTWLFPSYSEALFRTYGAPVRETALALLASGAELMNRGCIGQMPEVVDGDVPHTLRGCGAQAWGNTELYRVLACLRER